jgi:ribosomal protein S18 acetylase RimI-like enzyme
MEVQWLSRTEKPEIVSVLASAFHEYPVLRFVLRTTSEEYERQLKALVGFNTEVRLMRGHPVLGIRTNGSLIAAALLDEPFVDPPQLPQRMLEELRMAIGDEAYQRNFLYETESSRFEPESPHHFLGMIGVLPEHQGKGYARDLLNEIRKISLAHPTSSGVCLSTEDSDNVRLYQRFGYNVIAEMDILEMHSWCMFLPVR